MLPSGNVAQKRHMTCLCLLDFDPKIFHILGFCRGRSTPFYAVLLRSTPLYAVLLRSTPFYAVLRATPNPRPRLLVTVLLQSSPTPENIFQKSNFFKEIKMTPPRFVHWAHMSNKFAIFCSRLSVGEKWAAWFFKIARARARARGRVRGLRAPKIKAATLRLRHFTYSVHFVYLAHLSACSAFGAQRACLCTHRPPADPFDRGAQPAAS